MAVTSPASTVESAVAEARAELCGPWAQLRVLLVADIEAAIQEERRNFESATVVKLGGSAVAVAGGVVSVVGFALLMASLGPALPLAIAGTVVAVGGGVGGGAAAVKHAANQKSIAKRVSEHFSASRLLLEQIVDQLTAALLTQVKRSVQLYRDRRLGSRVCRLLTWLLTEIRSCRQLHARLLAEAGVPQKRVSAIPAAQRAEQLLALVSAAHECVVDRLADDFVGRGVFDDLRQRRSSTASKSLDRSFDKRSLQKTAAEFNRNSSNTREIDGGSEQQTYAEAHANRGFRVDDRINALPDKTSPSADSAADTLEPAELTSEECERLLTALSSAARLTLSLARVSLFGSADAGNLPTGEALATSLQSAALHCSLGIAEGVVQGVGRASALSMARVLGTAFGSAVSTAFDAGLLVYYAKQLHDFRRRGRDPELVVQLQAMRLTVQFQHTEVLNLCTVDRPASTEY